MSVASTRIVVPVSRTIGLSWSSSLKPSDVFDQVAQVDAATAPAMNTTP